MDQSTPHRTEASPSEPTPTEPTPTGAHATRGTGWAMPVITLLGVAAAIVAAFVGSGAL
ncbi:tryptophan-rich sensory protein, partial [Dietzia sp. Cai40]|nr:tryptophan-rich sensory protein [Dietzia sp. Cai40]